jgi:hypothetical protein
MTTSPKNRLYKTRTALKQFLRVTYPAGRGRMVLRTELDWTRDIEPVAISDDGTTSMFEVEADQPYRWTANWTRLALASGGGTCRAGDFAEQQACEVW